MKRFAVIIFFLWARGPSVFSQNISGIINIYTPVTAINATTCIPSITVVSSVGFSVGDTVLIIQMKGAQIDTTNTTAFGAISSYGDCGNYEFNVIAGVAGNVITLQNTLLRTYTVSQFVQLVSVPVYTNANISGVLTAKTWSVTPGTGGVLAFIDKGTTTFNADIDIRNTGFQGTSSQVTGWISCSTNFIEPSSAIEALKGESIAILGNNFTEGTGAPANGGGGGITDNGGAGAGNFAAGGMGGQLGWMASCSTRAQPGKGLTYSNALNKVFLGGAGGDAQRSEGPGTNMGVNGAGIAIIRSAGITGNNFSILAQGTGAPTTAQDGGGGGGAGGTVLLDCPVYTGTLKVNTSGGKGGDANVYTPISCSGGGGAGGGIVWVSLPAVPANIVYTSTGGVGGLSQSTINGDPGNPGGSLTNLVIPQSTAVGTMSITAVSANIQCSGQNNGTASVVAAGGTAPFTYLWSNGQSTSAVSGLAAGTYTVNVNDNAGCATVMTVQITQPALLSVTISGTGSSCSSTGNAVANVSGGSPSYSYSWSNGQSVQTATGLASGTYTVIISDSLGCVVTQTVSISQPPSVTVSVAAVNASCGLSNGSATANTSGGTAAFTYMWGTGQSTQSVSGLAAGTYTVLVTDSNGCTDTSGVTIQQSPALTSSVAVTSTTCGNSTGTASVFAGGGAGSFTYNWNAGGQTTATATGLAAGIYSCTVADAAGCSLVVTANVPNSNGPLATVSVNNNVSCNGGSNGSASANATGGTPGYTYSWSNGQSVQNVSGLSAGVYVVTVSDLNGCTSQQTVNITQPLPLSLTLLTASDTCAQNTGSAGAIVSNGTSPYSYSWSNGQSTQIATGLTAGNYSVLITDGNGCTKSANASVGSVIVNSAFANGSTTIILGSSAQLNAGGGIAYSWTPGLGLTDSTSANPVASPTVTTAYCVYVTNAAGCQDSLCLTVYVDLPCGEFYIPNAFSPNNDYENDVFRAYINPRCVAEFKLVIYNRWGEMVFETENVVNGWNGVYRDKISDSAVYAFYCKVKFTDGQEILKEGNVSLVR